MRKPWLFFLLGALLFLGGLADGLTPHHVEVDLTTGGVVDHQLQLNCGSAFFHHRPVVNGTDYTALCGNSRVTRSPLDYTVPMMGGLALIAAGVAQKRRSPAPASGAQLS